MISLIKRGFTLIELLIVIAIVGILTALVTTNLQGARSRARDTRRKSDLRAIEQSLRLYYNDHKQFPLSQDDKIRGCDDLPCSWGTAFKTGDTIYMSVLPTDPSSSTTTPITYKYISSDDDKYLLVATLENLSDSDIADTQSRCSTLYGSYSGSESTDYVVCAQ